MNLKNKIMNNLWWYWNHPSAIKYKTPVPIMTRWVMYNRVLTYVVNSVADERPLPYGLCGMLLRILIEEGYGKHLDPANLNARHIDVLKMLPELREVRPRNKQSWQYWWSKFDKESRIKALHQMIESVKKKI